jgi:hypothetical protein
LIDGTKGKIYDIVFTGSPAKKMKFILRTVSNNTGITIRIAYPGAGSRAIFLGGKEIIYNKWNEALRTYGAIEQTTCGENRYIGIKNILEFYITGGCTLDIKPRNAI